MINLGKLVQHKSNDKSKIFGQFGDEWCDWCYVFCYFLFISGFFRENLTCPKNHKQKRTPTKMSTWGITSMKNDSNAHRFMQSVRSYLSVKTCIISKLFTWFAKHINSLVSISKYFRRDYNIVCLQGNIHRPLVSSSYNHGVKMIFFLPGVQPMCAWLVKRLRQKI